MSNNKNYVIVFTITAAICFQVVAGWSTIICDDLDHAMSQYQLQHGIIFTEDRVLEFAKYWITEHTSLFSDDRKLIKALENIYKDECSGQSWDHLLVLSRCKDYKRLEVLDKPIKSYAKRCLTPDYVSKKIKAGTSGLISFDVKFIDTEFVKKFYEDNPNDIPLHVNWIGDEYWVSYHSSDKVPRADPDVNCCRPKRSFGAVIDAMNRNLAKHGTDVSSKFYRKPEELYRYLDKKLYQPCKHFVSLYSDLAWEFVKVSKYYEGKHQELIKTLDQDTKNILFRFKYCEMIKRDKYILEEGLRKKFVDFKLAEHRN